MSEIVDAFKRTYLNLSGVIVKEIWIKLSWKIPIVKTKECKKDPQSSTRKVTTEMRTNEHIFTRRKEEN